MTIIGEDEMSFQRHIKVLQSENAKVHPNQHIVNELMEKTFTHRRDDILHNVYDISTLLNKYPFLSRVDQVYYNVYTCIGIIY